MNTNRPEETIHAVCILADGTAEAHMIPEATPRRLVVQRDEFAGGPRWYNLPDDFTAPVAVERLTIDLVRTRFRIAGEAFVYHESPPCNGGDCECALCQAASGELRREPPEPHNGGDR